MTSPTSGPAKGPALGPAMARVDAPDDGPILKMKTADIGRTISAPVEPEVVRKPFGEAPKGYE